MMQLTMTPKQRAVAALVAEGKCNKRIAVELGITITAVRRRLEEARRKLGGGNRALVAAWYVRHEAQR